jgi:pimeloyl-ACP methyl ester carboxylesterase
VSESGYDEFSYFDENLSEWDLDVPVPTVRRFFVAVDGLRQISGLRWGDGDPELALLHGGAQNAHTFDTVALALQRPLVALDLPGHGHSDPSPFGPTSSVTHALDVARALEQLLSGPRPLVGMSLGGMTAIMVAHDHPELVSSLVLIDITPGVNEAKAKHITDFINGPASFDDFDVLLERTVAHNPTRSISSLRRGILHPALQRADGTWVWRHQQHSPATLEAPSVGDLWAMLEELAMPITLLRGMSFGSVVDDEDEVELLRRAPQATIVHVPGAGHSIQGDAPLELAALLNQYCA